MLNNFFSNLDDPTHQQNVLDEISSIESKIDLQNILKMLSYKIQQGEISLEHAKILEEALIRREIDLDEIQKHNRNKKSKSLHFAPTSVSNRVGTASIIFLVTNVAITTVMYTLLIISHFLNK